jgi:hypothetical protein
MKFAPDKTACQFAGPTWRSTSQKLVLCTLFACLVAVAAAMIGCGGGSSNLSTSAACTGGPYNVVGDWTLTTSSASGPGVINSSGLAVFFQTNTSVPAPGDTAVFPTISGACSFSGTATAYATQFSGGGSTSNTVSGTVSSTTSISGTISGTSSGTTNFSMTSNSPLSGSVKALSGNQWLGEFEGMTVPVIWNIVFSSTGSGSSMSFNGFGTAPDGSACYMSGTFNQEGGSGTDLNVFDVSITSLDGGCPLEASVTGLGFESSSDYFNLNGNAPGTYFYAIPSNSAAVLEIFPQTP